MGLWKYVGAGGSCDAELAHPRDVIQVTADDLAWARPAEGAWRRGASTRRPSRATSVSPSSTTSTGVPVEEDPSKFHCASQSRLYLNVVVQTSTVGLWVTPRQSATFPNVRQGGKMSSEFNRLRVLWPDHLGLPRGKYIPRRASPTTGCAIARGPGRSASTAR